MYNNHLLIIFTDAGPSLIVIVIPVAVIVFVMVIITIGEFIKLLLTLNDCYKFILVIVILVVINGKRKQSKPSGEYNYDNFLDFI